MRADANTRYEKRWRQLGELISALGKVDEPVDIDWNIDSMMHLRLDGLLRFSPAAFARAQRQQIDMEFLGDDWDDVHGYMIALMRTHLTPAAERSGICGERVRKATGDYFE